MRRYHSIFVCLCFAATFWFVRRILNSPSGASGPSSGHPRLAGHSPLEQDINHVISSRREPPIYNIQKPTGKRQIEDFFVVDAAVHELVQGLVDDKVSAYHPELVQVIRDYFLDVPRGRMTKFSHTIYQTLQAQKVDTLLKKKNGFFVECGALDGERSSNTDWLEQKRGWTGLLVEMDPFFYLQLLGKNRDSYSINACLSPERHPVILQFYEDYGGHGNLVMGESKDGLSHPRTYCFPLFSLMLALNRSHIDYFSLDVEGAEMAILRTIPFDELDISIFTIEYSHQDSQREIVRFMESKGYVMHERLSLNKPELTYFCDDYLFVKKSVLAQPIK